MLYKDFLKLYEERMEKIVQVWEYLKETKNPQIFLLDGLCELKYIPKGTRKGQKRSFYSWRYCLNEEIRLFVDDGVLERAEFYYYDNHSSIRWRKQINTKKYFNTLCEIWDLFDKILANESCVVDNTEENKKRKRDDISHNIQ